MTKIILCKNLEKHFFVNEEAIELLPSMCCNEAVKKHKYGWLCECGKWTAEDPNNHKIIYYETVDEYYSKIEDWDDFEDWLNTLPEVK